MCLLAHKLCYYIQNTPSERFIDNMLFEFTVKLVLIGQLIGEKNPQRALC